MKNFFMVVVAYGLLSFIVTVVFLIIAILGLIKWARILLKDPSEVSDTEIARAKKFKELSLASFASVAITVITHFLISIN